MKRNVNAVDLPQIEDVQRDSVGFILPPELVKRKRKREKATDRTTETTTGPRKTKKCVTGNCNPTALRCAPSRYELFVCRLTKESPPEQITAFLKAEHNIAMIEIECVSKEGMYIPNHTESPLRDMS